MKKNNIKRFLGFFAVCFSIIIAIVAVTTAVTFKINIGYRPSIYNYGSYLNPTIKKDLAKKYNYKVFNNINDFTVALNNEKAIAGVGSDFQAAQLIIDDKIKKFDFPLLFNTDDNTLESLSKVYRKEIIEHLKYYDNYILQTIKNKYPKKLLSPTTYDVDGDKKPDHFWEYIVPYYSQDKVIAYNINDEFRPNIKLTEQEKENGISFKDNSWYGILQTLKQHGYTNYGWTNAYYDNLMIGAFYGEHKNPGSWIDKKTHQLKQFDFSNYIEAIDNFSEFVKDVTTFDIRDTSHNFSIGDGLELLNTLIEPKFNKADAAILYNGDAIDAYYSSDNYEGTEDGNIRFIRPKNNYLLLDNWIQAKSLSSKQSREFILEIKNKIYKGVDAQKGSEFTFNLYEKAFLESIKDQLPETLDSSIEKDSVTEKLYKLLKKDSYSTEDIEKIYELHMEDEDAWSDEFANAFTENIYPEINNFDYINYTPANIAIYNFIRKWYFGTDEVAINLYEQPTSNKDYHVYSYQIIDTQLRTAISAYNYKTIKS